jgi:glycosyltransferase involved in cell wall biosynthesis
MATFNGAGYIREQLESILHSPLVNEVVVSDDGSSDDTLDIIRSIADERIVLLNGPRLGLIRNFEHALSHATGDVIFLSDQDDIWLPEKVPRVLEYLRDSVLVITDCKVVDADLNVIHSSFFQFNQSGPGLLRNLFKNGYLGCCMTMRRSVLQIALPFPPKIAMHDWWLGLIASSVGRVNFAEDSLIMYRRHGTNASVTTQRSEYSLWRRLYWRAYLLACLLGRRKGRYKVLP